MRKLTSRETLMLLAVGGIAIVGWIYGRGGTLGVGGSVDPNLAALNYADPPMVELARLGLSPDAYDSSARNLFSYYIPPPPPRPKRTTVEAKPKPRPQGPTSLQRGPRPQLPPQVPKPPRPGFRYIGFLGPKNNKIAVLEKGDEVMLAAVGEVIEKQFVVVEFKYEILVLGYTTERWAAETTELPMKR